MRLAHKRNVQNKLQKRMKAFVVNQTLKQSSETKMQASVSSGQPKVAKIVNENLTPKQAQVLEIVAQHADGINPKSIGLEAGQEEAKAASWATGALKKLLEDNLVEKVQLTGNKVLYKRA
ncbi:MarR family transcriptional regulator [Vibrio ruber]|uniref:MarR family transcriptional regulator n=1 Tax=Vibrio ruber TaxID=184755 RepID=UPI002892D190|nr:MarR family transcriptional regulator [Vibrio ruber]WNJ95243.1 MarR family transcriptional regulator [Vibrio ruber]